MHKTLIDVVIPAFNEENSVGNVVRDLPESVREVVVVNNNSRDDTRQNAQAAGATVLDEPRQGYGYACLKGIDYLENKPNPPEILVFVDADYSDYPGELTKIVDYLLENNLDMVIGSRALGEREAGAMTPQQVFGNWLATNLIERFYGVVYTDLGPFRAIRFDKLLAMKMVDTTYGWTVEMQLKAAKMGMAVGEVPVTYRKRIGHSKVSGTLKGTVLAGYKILSWIFKYR
ncbi:glycosyltransferase family 2 protein [Persicitalea sp.]|uniref:glycosyltransferase family 2 protein n=1 Tax=Persicitalea sp. TaxID=3100273 RepID=UPI003593ADD8